MSHALIPPDASGSLRTPAWRPGTEVELIVGTPPGGGQDRPARALMQVLAAAGLVGVPMRLTNVPGKGGGNGWDVVRRRAGDPHVLSISSAPLLTNRLLGVSDYDHSAFTPIANLYTEYLAFVARAGSPLRDCSDFLDRLKSDPGGITISFATATGTTNHLALGQIMRHVGGDPGALRLRVFESAPYAVSDVIEGHAEVGVISAVSAAQALESGKLRAFAVSAPARMGGLFADVPTWAEHAVPCTIGQWRGIMGAPGIGTGEVAFWEQALAAAVPRPEWAAELASNYWSDTYMGAEETRAFLDRERTFLAGMLHDLGLIR